jgi:hypothetical protein
LASINHRSDRSLAETELASRLESQQIFPSRVSANDLITAFLAVQRRWNQRIRFQYQTLFV